MRNITVSFNTKAVRINMRLIRDQKAHKNLKKIIIAHWMRLAIIELMEETSDKALLRNLAEDIATIDFELQSYWGFPKDAGYHIFWELPHCSCPVSDNWYRYGTGTSIRVLNCILHGD